MDISLTPQLMELYQSFIVLNYKLYKFKYGQTAEGRQRLELYNRIVTAIHELGSQKIADLNSVHLSLSLTFPMIPVPLLEEMAENLDHLAATGRFDLSSYTETLFYMSTITTSCNQQIAKLLPLFRMRSGKHSRLDSLECKKQVIEIFKKIKELEKTNTAQGRTSAFATVFQQELRPLLKDTDYFKEHLEEDDDFEKTYKVNNRAYKSLKKLYSTWKKNSGSKLEKVLMFFDKNLWQLSWSSVQKNADITSENISAFLNFIKNIDEIISNER